MTAPAGATHILDGAYYRKRPQGGADYWCDNGKRWVYMEDRSAYKAIRAGRRIETK